MEPISRKDAMSLGLKRYFTGKPCTRGHIDYRSTCDHSCFACNRIKSANQKKDPETIKRHRAARKEKYHSDPEVRKIAVKKTAEWVAKNKERSAAYFKAYYLRNKERALSEDKARREARRNDPEWVAKERERCRLKNLKNPEQKRSDTRNRRARLRKAEGRHTFKDVEAILERQGYTCVYCNSCLREKYEVDHIMPISRGGTNWPSNLQCLCPDCNGRKWCKHPDDFAKEIAASLAISGEAGGQSLA